MKTKWITLGLLATAVVLAVAGTVVVADSVTCKSYCIGEARDCTSSSSVATGDGTGVIGCSHYPATDDCPEKPCYRCVGGDANVFYCEVSYSSVGWCQNLGQRTCGETWGSVCGIVNGGAGGDICFCNPNYYTNQHTTCSVIVCK